MTYKGDPIAEKLDKVAAFLASAVGLTRLQRRFASGRMLRFRFIPLALLAFAVAGLWIQIARSDAFGYVIVMIAWITSFTIQGLSPLRTGQERLDEREAALVQSGHFTGLIAAMSVAVLGCIAIAMGSIAEAARLGSFWAPDDGLDWFALALFLLAVEANVAVMAASAKLPEDLDDDEE